MNLLIKQAKKWIGLWLLVGVLSGCSTLHDQYGSAPQQSSKGLFQLSVEKSLKISTAQLRTLSSIPTYFIYSIDTQDGTSVKKHQRVDLISTYTISQPITIDSGYYQLTEFFVYDQDGNCLYTTPIKDSPRAYLVKQPLPISFNITANSTSTLNIEVLSANGLPSDFGYAQVSFNIQQTRSFYIAVLEDNSNFATANIEIKSGSQVLVQKQLAAKTNEIELLDLTNQTYSIRISKSNYPDIIRTVSKEDLKSYATQPLVMMIGDIQFTPLTIAGNRIYNKNNQSVVFRGVNIADPLVLSQNAISGDRLFQVLKEDWNANIIRVPIHPGFYKANSNYLKEYVDPIVQYGKKYKLYVLLDWHGIGNLQTGESPIFDWFSQAPWNTLISPNTPYNADMTLAQTFFSEAGARYKDAYWVIYGTFNEPENITWSAHKACTEQLIDTLRFQNPNAIVTVSGTNWGYQLDTAVSNPIGRNQVIYETHIYPGRPSSEWQVFVKNLSQTHPILLGEWGFTDTDGQFKADDTYATTIMSFANQNQIHWTAWCFHNDWFPNMVTDMTTLTPTHFGYLVKQALQSR